MDCNGQSRDGPSRGTGTGTGTGWWPVREDGGEEEGRKLCPMKEGEWWL